MTTSTSHTAWGFGLVVTIALAGAAVYGLGAGCSNNGDDWLAELNDPSPVRRAGGVRVLWKRGDDRAYALANKALTDRSSIVRVAAVRALADFKTRDTTIALIRAAHDADPEVRLVAVEKLGQRRTPKTTKALVEIMVRGEPNLEVRRQVRDSLAKRGLSNAELADRLASQRMARIQKLYKDAQPAQRARLVRQAGNIAGDQGLKIVIGALSDGDAAVVLAGLGVLDGRGGEKALKRLIKLTADNSQKVRLAAVKALGRFGKQGQAVIEGALRDVDYAVRIEALATLAAAGVKLDPQTVCPLLREGEIGETVEIARLLHSEDVDCPVTELGAALSKRADPAYRRALEVLTALGNAAARGALEQAIGRSKGARGDELLVALARAGGSRKGLGRKLESILKARLEKLEIAARNWVHGKLPPGKNEPAEATHKNRLSEEELKKLMKKHGLEPPGPGAPRGVSDILAKYDDDTAETSKSKLFVLGDGRLCKLAADGLDGLLMVDPGRAAGLLPRCLGFSESRIVGRMAAVLVDRKYKPDLDADLIKRLAGLLGRADVNSAAAIAGLLGASGKIEAARAIAAALKGANFEKRDKLIGVLGSMRMKETVSSLVPLLKGYSAGSVARALAQIGDRAAIEPLRQALKTVGLSAELELLAALARLGDKDIAKNLSEKIEDRDPLVRLAAVRIFALLGEPYSHKQLARARFDPDRRVRLEADKLFSAGGKE